ncbi:MAG: hypothetical protein A2204_03215 [Elusimicrobia bacterium RIFOXYA1_FULL_47_7]|nr:MAG: hypothetical protein A2278_01725 [Elusimicrobia bacterium RIFOXYA12_FULL_49_49]OGS09069.1 MAG: hypothetical protein A2204_03215 [Elusimicrobia bacterium RIFOXYA1_FULL_47_7]OGS16768.1 MAG: hypothetical protein A2251_05175 [Elusimicrobia bacterium RIFOXYA2_FULL_47_53]OGS31996.1 MAG: hypothetical protein A2323_07950 [Elusimicrobia bacterium RIFOXYB2_FULL_46_23]
MNIGINARYLQKRSTGIENYLKNIIAKLKDTDKSNSYTLFFGNDRQVPDYALGGNFTHDVPDMRTDSQLKRVLWEHFYLPKQLKKLKIDVFHEPSFISPFFKSCPTIITVYDLAYLFCPDCYTFRNRAYLGAMLSRSVSTSEYIIAISENTKSDILKHFRVPDNKVKVIYCGVNELFKKTNDTLKVDSIRKKYGITKDYILNVSLISPRKNLIALMQAFKNARQSGRIDAQLVIAGGKGWLYEKIIAYAKSSGFENDIIFTGYVTDDELLHLYNGARLFAFPSVYEGFGLPLLEAMACGCPVISSNTSSMPEVCGEAALYFNPKNLAEISEAIDRVINDVGLSNSLINKGLEQVKKFSWGKAAAQTLSLYEKSA